MHDHKTESVEKTLSRGGFEAVRFRAVFPVFPTLPGLTYICRRTVNECFKKACFLLSSALRQREKLGSSFSPFINEVSFEIMRSDEYIVSVFGDFYSDMGMEGTALKRYAVTWDAKRDIRLNNPHSLTGISPREMYDAVSAVCGNDPTSYFSDWQKRISAKPCGFYLTDEGCVLFWQRGDIAPSGGGIPSFFIPYK